VSARLAAVLLLAGILGGCRGDARGSDPSRDLAALVDSLAPAVEQATGLSFRSPPKSALRSRDQVRAYLLRKLDEELPPARLRGIETAYRLFGLLPDTVQLRGLLLDLYTEQVAGFYDPDSAMLFGVEGADRSQLRLVLAHELIHALQGQYLPLDSILTATSNNDRLTAAQAILEGQATLASLDVLAPGQDVAGKPEFWELYREQVRAQQSSMPVFRRAPLVLRESLIFPYLQGAEFMHWWRRSPLADTLPYGPRMPVSSEQVLHPDRYARGDLPLGLAFAPDSAPPTYEDVMGESEIRVILAVLAGSDEVQTVVPLGWGDDRYRLYAATEGPALVWYVVWDDARAAGRFLRAAAAAWGRPSRPGYRAAVDSLEVDGRAATRYVLAPSSWPGWSSIPAARLTEAP
jgi:hypothetical protein